MNIYLIYYLFILTYFDRFIFKNLLTINFDNDIKCEYLYISKLAKDIKLFNSFENDMNLKHPLILKLIKDLKFLNPFGSEFKIEYYYI